MNNKKATFYVIVGLLVIFLPLTVFETVIKLQNRNIEENPNHDFFYDGYLWFYSDTNELLSKYECMTEVCELAKTTIDDADYGINYYTEGTIEQLPILGDYAFITDGSEIKLYNITSGNTLDTYKAIKDYHTKLGSNSVIVQNNSGLWGMFSFENNLNSILPFEYNFIGIGNNPLEGFLSISKMITLKDNKWAIVDNTNSMLSGYIDDPIVDYNDEYIISKNDNIFKVYGYNDTEYFMDMQITNYVRLDNYLGIVEGNTLRVYNSLNNDPIKEITLPSPDSKIEFQMEEGNLNILIDNSASDTLAI